MEATTSTYKFKMQIHDESSLDTSTSSQQTARQEETTPPEKPPEADMVETEEKDESLVATENGEEVETGEEATEGQATVD